jgi:hypothetical protein
MLHISLCHDKHFANNYIIGSGNDTTLLLCSIYGTTDANKSYCLMNDFEVNIANVGMNVDLADMKRIDSDNSLFGVTSFDSDIVDDFNKTHDYDCRKGQRTTAITKLQSMLNEVINNQNASLKMHDDIVHLFNKYILSPSFDKYATLKMRKAFIQLMEKSFRVIHLQPKHTKVKVHNGSVVTVPVFDAKLMILDILTNPICMQESNFAPGQGTMYSLVMWMKTMMRIKGMVRFTQTMLGYLLGIYFLIQMIMETTCQLD